MPKNPKSSNKSSKSKNKHDDDVRRPTISTSPGHLRPTISDANYRGPMTRSRSRSASPAPNQRGSVRRGRSPSPSRRSGGERGTHQKIVKKSSKEAASSTGPRIRKPRPKSVVQEDNTQRSKTNQKSSKNKIKGQNYPSTGYTPGKTWVDVSNTSKALLDGVKDVAYTTFYVDPLHDLSAAEKAKRNLPPPVRDVRKIVPFPLGEKKNRKVPFFNTSHRVWGFSIAAVVFMYFGFISGTDDEQTNFYKSFVACFSVLALFGITYFKDSHFSRPHPVFWRFVLALSLTYALTLTFVLFATRENAQKMAQFVGFGEKVQPVGEEYGLHCKIYDSSLEDPWKNVKDVVFDIFILAHILGWFAKFTILRDWNLCIFLSIFYEFLEVTFRHWLPNFRECWWDHIIVDILICNTLGMYLGYKFLQWAKCKTYNNIGFYEVQGFKNKFKRAIGQFAPMDWDSFQIKAAQDPTHFFMLLISLTIICMVELNAFFLKYVLYIPSEHPFNAGRCTFVWLQGCLAYREFYEFLYNKNAKLGAHAMLSLSIVIMEALICLKFGIDIFTDPFPDFVVYIWIGIFSSLIGFILYRFILFPKNLSHSKYLKS